MSHNVFVNIVHLVAGAGLATVLVGVTSGFNNGRPKRMAQGKIVYRRPGLRTFFFVGCGLTVALAVGMTWGSRAFWVLSIQSGLAMPLLLFLAGPEQIQIDPSKRTYRMKTGWPVFPRRRDGTLDEALGLCVLDVTSGLHLAKLAWRDPARPSITLGQSTNKEWAMRLAQEAAEMLQLDLLTDYQPARLTRTRP